MKVNGVGQPALVTKAPAAHFDGLDPAVEAFCQTIASLQDDRIKEALQLPFNGPGRCFDRLKPTPASPRTNRAPRLGGPRRGTPRAPIASGGDLDVLRACEQPRQPAFQSSLLGKPATRCQRQAPACHNLGPTPIRCRASQLPGNCREGSTPQFHTYLGLRGDPNMCSAS